MKTKCRHGNCRRIKPRRIACLLLVTPLLATGCSHSPEYSIFGSFFPAWIFCSAGGLVLAAGARAVVARSPVAEYATASVLLYFSVAVFFACALWLLFYS